LLTCAKAQRTAASRCLDRALAAAEKRRMHRTQRELLKRAVESGIADGCDVRLGRLTCKDGGLRALDGREYGRVAPLVAIDANAQIHLGRIVIRAVSRH
jgi:hypothetical protein